jgi:maleate isomerase
MNIYPNVKHRIIGALSGREITIADANIPPMPAIAVPGIIYNGNPIVDFGLIDSALAYPDVCSFKRKFGLLIPATNTSMEYELWKIIFNNSGTNGLDGIGLHTANVLTPKPQLATKEDLLQYKEQFLSGLKTAVDQILLAQPQYLIMGMSLEHIIKGIEGVRAPLIDVERYSGLSCAGWHDASHAALKKINAKRIGLLTAFDATGNENAAQMFTDLGYEVVASVGFSCANAMHIAHVPNWAKEKAIME